MSVRLAAPGTDIARALSNVLLFSGGERLPNVLVMIARTDGGGLSFIGCDDYVVAADSAVHGGGWGFELEIADCEAIVKFARAARGHDVYVEYAPLQRRCMVSTEGQSIEFRTVRPAGMRADDWKSALDVLATDSGTAPVPQTVAMSPARVARFGRVKAIKDAPMDVRFYGRSASAPIALVKIGPTFLAGFSCVPRDVAQRKGLSADCFWPEG